MSFQLPSCSTAKKQQEYLAPTTNCIVQPSASSSNHAKNMHPPKGNPYAKRKEPTSFADTTYQSSRSSEESLVCAPRKINSSSSIGQGTVQIPAYIVPMPTFGPNATFSQAFSAIDHSTDAIHNESADSLRTEQVSFEQEKSSESLGLSSRENHINLQTHVLHVANRQRGNG